MVGSLYHKRQALIWGRLVSYLGEQMRRREQGCCQRQRGLLRRQVERQTVPLH